MYSLAIFQNEIQEHVNYLYDCLNDKYFVDDRQQVARALLEASAVGEQEIPSKMSSFSSVNIENYDGQLLPPNSINNIGTQFYDFHGKRIIGFCIGHRQMICLPQIYELFLKQHVGGLHTVYTKLKRLKIQPIICNVDQVRVLRNLGAIQPGVNRCKLIDRKDLDKLYLDCTQSSSRPGRPPKKVLQFDNFHQNAENLLNVPSISTLPPIFPTNTSILSDSGSNDGNSLPHFLPLTAHQIFVQQLMAAATALAAQQPENKNNSKLDEMTKSDEKATNGSDTKPDWNQDKNEKETPSPNENSVSSNENCLAPSLPSNSNSSESDNFSFDREKSSSLMNSSERGSSSGSSSDTPTRNMDMQNMFTKFTTTVDEMEKRFTEHYDKLSAMAAKMQNLEEQLIRNLASHKERSQHYYRRYITTKYQAASLKHKILYIKKVDG